MTKKEVVAPLMKSLPPVAYNSKQLGLLRSWTSRTCRHDRINDDGLIKCGWVSFERFVGRLKRYLNVFQRNNSSRFFIGGVLEVIETVVIENKPAPLPWFISATWNKSPALVHLMKSSLISTQQLNNGSFQTELTRPIISHEVNVVHWVNNSC